jgi:hypothetical protein
VVRGRRDPQAGRCGRQLRSLPRVDALAVHALEATADPASPLALAFPIALLDGQPAGPHGWAALLSRRLFERGAGRW